MIKLTDKKEAFSDWIEIAEGQKILAELPTIEQKKKINRLQFGTISVSDGTPSGTISNQAIHEATALYLKYTIKDWEGVGVPCKVVNGELDNKLWESLVFDGNNEYKFEHNMVLANKIKDAIEPNETDKKK